ncbi:LysR family transcriptional regulator [Pseudomonas antarctica]|uniref:LysR family transcriptional regulator n=1 Tax=Pseudomonas antarctica TaxID=219572 RepID=UPI003F74F5EC
MSSSGVDDLVTFVAVAKAGSFKAAAATLGRDASVISRRISQLEARLGVRLLIRTTRSVTLTEAGAFYFDRLRMSLDELDAATREVGGFATQPKGVLKLSAPATFGRELIIPVLSKIVQAFPDIKFDVHFSDRLVDIVGEGFDVVLRVGTLPDSSFQYRKLGSFRCILVASPSYLDQHGAPDTVESLNAHACIGFTRFPGWPNWTIEKLGARVTFRPKCPIVADNSEGILIAALEGTGIALSPDYMAAAHLRAGTLVHVLPGWRSTEDTGIHALMPPGTLVPAKSRILVDELALALGDKGSDTSC